MTVKFTDEMDALLGTMSDLRVAKKVGCSRVTVTKRRLALGIDPANGWEARKYASVLDSFVDLLGTMPDSEIAKLAGCSRELVRQRRSAAGIGGYVAPKSIQPPRVKTAYHRPALVVAMDKAALLETRDGGWTNGNPANPFTVAELADALDRPVHLLRPTFARWVAEGAFVHVGYADPARGGRAGLYVVGETVNVSRGQLGEEFDHLLGTMSDYALAERLKGSVSYTQILSRRKKLGIKAFGGRE